MVKHTASGHTSGKGQSQDRSKGRLSPNLITIKFQYSKHQYNYAIYAFLFILTETQRGNMAINSI